MTFADGLAFSSPDSPDRRHHGDRHCSDRAIDRMRRRRVFPWSPITQSHFIVANSGRKEIFHVDRLISFTVVKNETPAQFIWIHRDRFKNNVRNFLIFGQKLYLENKIRPAEFHKIKVRHGLGRFPFAKIPSSLVLRVEWYPGFFNLIFHWSKHRWFGR